MMMMIITVEMRLIVVLLLNSFAVYDDHGIKISRKIRLRIELLKQQ